MYDVNSRLFWNELGMRNSFQFLIFWLIAIFHLFKNEFILWQALANQLLDSKVNIDEFLEQYIAERKIYHLRKIKADKMAGLVRRGPQTQQQGQSYYGAGYGRY